jgi:hypothetical protein
MEVIRSDRACARELRREAVAGARTVGEQRVLALALRHLATIDRVAGAGPRRPCAPPSRSPSRSRAADYPREVGCSSSMLGRVVPEQGDEAARLASLAEGRRILRQVGGRDALAPSCGPQAVARWPAPTTRRAGCSTRCA